MDSATSRLSKHGRKRIGALKLLNAICAWKRLMYKQSIWLLKPQACPDGKKDSVKMQGWSRNMSLNGSSGGYDHYTIVHGHASFLYSSTRRARPCASSRKGAKDVNLVRRVYPSFTEVTGAQSC
ncbi:hypothetical protein VNO77_15115 [Canavalia gladiata]|uniref:Uncharacterized protein n=1 Tax=Canavalia gladiata TaxID=3824 RepID=A0AAN9QP15_CANGL